MTELFSQEEKDRIELLVRQELSKIAEQKHRTHMTLARLNDLYNIEKEEEEDKKDDDDIEHYKHNIRDLQCVLEIINQDFNLLENIKNKLTT